jgi:imidazoleglycerol-phosphate dehydratase
MATTKRSASITRETSETSIAISLSIDGSGKSKVTTPIGFFSHMLEAFSKHGLFDLRATISGDTHVDQHHTVEDTGIVLGQAFKQALGDKKGILRSGSFAYPMDEALAVVAIDISGRPHVQYMVKFRRRFCGELDTDVLPEFFHGFAAGLGANIAIHMHIGRSDHHKIEAIFKAFGKSLLMACLRSDRIGNRVLSTKGSLD